MRYSVQILAGNCASTIVRCLESVKFMDEIVIVYDTRSTDNTLQVIGAWADTNNHVNARILNFDWPGDSFAETRNFGISHCTGDWLIILDADEELRDWQVPDSQYLYYLSNVYKEGLTFRGIRMFQLDQGIKYVGSKHNQLNCEIDRSRLGYNVIVFHGFTITPPDAVIAKTKRILKRLIQELEEGAETETVHFNICRCHYGLSQWADCIEMGHLALQDPIETPHRAQVLIYLHIAYLHLGRWYAAGKWLEKSVSLLTNQLWGWCLMYERYHRLGDFTRAGQIKDIILATEISYLPMDMGAEQVEHLFSTLPLPEETQQITQNLNTEEYA